MTKIAYAYPTTFQLPGAMDIPGMERFSYVTKIYGGWVMPHDRTGVVVTPMDAVSLFPMPTFRAFTKTYEEICDDRAKELLKSAEDLDINIYMMYSGGIDSTCVMVSLLKHATPDQKKRIIVLLSPDSIVENPRFYDDHIKGKVRVESSIRFPELLGANDMLLSAEHNDLVMGNATASAMIARFGAPSVHEPYSRTLLVSLFTEAAKGNKEIAIFYYEMFEKLAKSAPVEIRTNFDFLWWYNFATKWQACYMYILFFTPRDRAHLITKEYLDTRFISFYNTDEFQLWSMNNLDKRIKDTWRSYKWIMKDIIYAFNHDADYRDNKTKVRSLPMVLKLLPHQNFLMADFRFVETLAPTDFILPENDFA